MERDVRIDVIRGAGILMIALDHLGAVLEQLAADRFVLPFVTWTRIGWSSAAEFFVFFSGYLIGLVYVRTLQARGPWNLQVRAVHRAWEIYAANVLTLCVVLALVYGTPFGGSGIAQAAQLTELVDGAAASAWVGFLSLQSAPMFFEILQLYVVLLVLAPLFLLLARVSMAAALLLSVAIWGAVQVDPSINLGSWHFNPFAWQLVFVLGMLCSVGKVFARIDALVQRRTMLLATGAILIAALIVKGLDKSGAALPFIGALQITGTDKAALEPLRLLHFLVSVLFVVQAMPRDPVIQRSLPMRSIARIGQFSLECFCMSTIVVYAAVGVLVNLGIVSTASVLLSGVALVLLICLFAVFMSWIRSEPWRGAPDGKVSKAPPQGDPGNAPVQSGVVRLAAAGAAQGEAQ